jgi:hypothetical protein
MMGGRGDWENGEEEEEWKNGMVEWWKIGMREDGSLDK